MTRIEHRPDCESLDMKSVLYIVFACAAFLHSATRASVQIDTNQGTMTLSADLNGNLTTRGTIDASDPTVLVDDYSSLVSDIFSKYAPQTTTRIFKTGINTGALAFYQASIHSSYQFYSADTDAELVSWHATRAALVTPSVASRCKALFGKPYRLLAAFNIAQLKHQVIFEDIYDGDEAEQAAMSTSTYFSMINQALDLPSSPLFIRHYYNYLSSVIQQDAADCKNNLFGSALVVTLTNTPQHVFIVTSSSISNCAALESDLTDSVIPFSCVDA